MLTFGSPLLSIFVRPHRLRRRALGALLVLAVGLSSAAAADGLSSGGPTYPAALTCFNGKIDAESACSQVGPAAKRPAEDAPAPGLTCGQPGHVSRVTWEYLGTKEGIDYYRVTRRFPADSRDATTTAKTVRFTGQRVVVFQDEFQVIVLDPPSAVRPPPPKDE